MRGLYDLLTFANVHRQELSCEAISRVDNEIHFSAFHSILVNDTVILFYALLSLLESHSRDFPFDVPLFLPRAGTYY